MHDVFVIILTAGASAGAAWWGGIIGVRREAEKLAQARAFDRRLDWYERAQKILMDYKKATLKTCQAIRKAGTESEVTRREYHEFVKQANDVLNEGALYARSTTIGAFRALESDLGATDPSQPDLDAVTRAIDRAWVQLVKEARDHLKLEPLPEDQFVTAKPAADKPREA
jgi:hypothetical protein